MKTLMSALWLVSSLAAGTALAQPAPPNEAGVTMGHWHLNSRDVEANKKIFVALGGVAAKPGDFDIVKFPGVVVFLHQRPGTPPPSGGTEGRPKPSPTSLRLSSSRLASANIDFGRRESSTRSNCDSK